MGAVGKVTGFHSMCHDPSKIVNDQFSHAFTKFELWYPCSVIEFIVPFLKSKIGHARGMLQTIARVWCMPMQEERF